MASKGFKPRTLYEKIFESKIVDERENGNVLLYIDRHLIHEVSSPQAFEGLREAGRRVRRPECTIATVDHNVSTSPRRVPKKRFGIEDVESRIQCQTLEENIIEFGIPYFGIQDKRQGIVHVIGPEQGLTLPGTTIVCGDSHTATHGAFGALAYGIGTSEVEHVLATQTLLSKKSKNMRVKVEGKLSRGMSSKDVVLHIIGKIGISGGTGTVIEYCGDVVRDMSMEARMSLCNMSIEAGARAGLVAPDEKTFQYIEGRPFAPKTADWDRAREYWMTLASDNNCVYDIDVSINADDIAPTVSWGTTPQDVVPITGVVPDPEGFDPSRKRTACRSLEYMNLSPGTRMSDIAIDNVFIGSCTNSRIEDLMAAASILKGRKVSENIKIAMVVPGSGLVKQQAERMGLDRVFIDSGFQWREAGCSMCVGLNSDTQQPGDRCASTSNRNFENRQGLGVRTHLMSPIMAAAAAITGKLTDFRSLLDPGEHVDISYPRADSTLDETEKSKANYDPIINMKKYPSGPQPSIDPPPARPNMWLGTVKGVAASLARSNIDTDMLFPKQFCKTIKRTGLGYALLYHLRFDDDGKERKDFILNMEPFRHTKILVVGKNFGCGSSRELAAWALKDFGISCIIGSSFADIFSTNCLHNGILLIAVHDTELLEKIFEEATASREIEVDLPNQRINNAVGDLIYEFEVDDFRKDRLLNGFEDIGLTLLAHKKIQDCELRRNLEMPWLSVPYQELKALSC